MEFKRGIIVSAVHSRSLCIGKHIAQELNIKSEDGTFYNICCPILKNEDLFGKGDKVSFLMDGHEVVNIRLNPF